jgi:acyl transferase domain-containing protein/phosphopantetheinyl transferase
MSQLDVAIVGLGCALPRAASVREFWRNNVNAVDCIEPLPPHRLAQASNWTLPVDHDAYLAPHRGGFLPQSLSFDPVRYGVMPNAVRHGEADQFVMLRVADEALADAGIGARDPRRERMDVIVGRGGYPAAKHVELWLRGELYETTLELIDRKYPDLLEGGRRDEVEAWLRHTLPPGETDSLATAIPNIVASRVANRLNLGGTAHCVDAACASSLLALEQAVDRLRLGKSDAAIVGGVFLTQSIPFLLVFNRLQAVSKSGMIRPMDRRADGLLMSEGAGAVVVKRLEDAVRDGDRIYAIVKGCGSSSDGKDVDVLAPAWRGQVRALQRAYADANVDPATIGYLELHGTGTAAGDLAEATTIKTFFGTSTHPPTSRAMGTVKSLIGHAMPASGIAALIRTALALSNKVLPPSLHCEEPRPEIVDAAFYVNTQTRPWVQSESRGPRRAAINSFGFGGVNGHVVLEEAEPTGSRATSRPLQPRPIEPGLDRASELALFSAETTPKLIARLERLLAFLAADQLNPSAADIARSTAADVNFAHPVKLAIVFKSLEDLREKLQKSIATLTDSNGAAPTSTPALPVPKAGQVISAAGPVALNLRNDEAIYFSSNAAQHEGKIAFIFPGMGFPGLIGNYPDHLLELCLHFPELRAEFDFFEERDRHPQDDIPTSAVFVPPATLPEEYRQKLKNRLAPPKTDADYMHEPQPEERYLAAMGVTLANWLSWTLLKSFEIPVEYAAGQSQGEMAAACAVGLGDFHATAPAYWKVLNVNPRYTDGGRLAFVWASEEQVLPLIAETPNTYVAIYMAPMALILGGDKDGLVKITETLKKQHCLTQILPYPPIHTPCLSHLHADLEDALKDEQFAVQPAKIKLYSSITTEPYPETLEGVRRTLMLNLDHPLRVWQTIRRMYDDGARIFVQVGGGHMSAHMKELMPEGARTITAALDVDTRNPITQLHHLLGTLFAAGVPFKADPLFAHRPTEVLDLDRPRPALAPPKLALPFRLEWSPLGHPDVPKRGPLAPREEQPAPAQPSDLATTLIPEPAAASHSLNETATPPHAATVDDIVLSPAVVEFDLPFPILQHARVVHFVPEQELRIERVLDVHEDLYIQDHLFTHCPSKPPSACLPIVPMTMSLEFIAEAAALLCPGLGLIAYEDVRALRWIGLEDKDRTLLQFEARLAAVDEATGERRIDVVVSYDDKKAFSGRVVFGTAYRQTIEQHWPELSADAPWPVPAEDIYPCRLMFHGPSFHVMTQLHHFANPFASGALRVLPKDQLFRGLPEPMLLTDPCLLDGIGQFVGLWCQMHRWFILPTGVEKIEFYGPTPPVGTDCPIKLVVTQFDVEIKQLKADFEIEDGQGNVWIRLSTWGDWIFKWTSRFLSFQQFPALYTLGYDAEVPGMSGDATVLRLDEADLVGVDLQWVARTALLETEMDEFRALSGNKAQRRFLMSRIAAKDAVRTWRQNITGKPLHPGEFVIRHDEHGKPLVDVFPDELVPQVTVAHKEQMVVAAASSGPLGVDLEPADRDTRSILSTFASDEEVRLLEPLFTQSPDGGWETRLWCAKEAAGKTRGTGLNGRPKRLRLVDADVQGRLAITDIDTGVVYDVQTSQLDGFLVAVAVPVTQTSTGSTRRASRASATV